MRVEIGAAIVIAVAGLTGVAMLADAIPLPIEQVAFLILGVFLL